MLNIELPEADLQTANIVELMIYDVKTLLTLVRADALPLLHQAGDRVCIATEVAVLAADYLDGPDKSRFCAWMDVGTAHRSAAPVIVERAGWFGSMDAGKPPAPERDRRAVNAAGDWMTRHEESDFNILIVLHTGDWRSTEHYKLVPDMFNLEVQEFINMGPLPGAVAALVANGRRGTLAAVRCEPPAASAA